MTRAQLGGFTVDLYMNGRRLPIYNDPEEGSDNSTAPRFYVEATTDAQFHIQTTLNEDFSWEDSATTTPLSVEKVQKLVKKDRLVFTRPDDYTQQSGGLDRVSKRLLKGKTVSNIIKSVAGPSCAAPLENSWCFASLSGQPGLPINFRILHRSRKTLQMLGCIPRTPSPQPSARSINDVNPLSNASPAAPPIVTAADPAQKIKDLRARLALLERSLIIKAEHTTPTRHANAGTTVKCERADKDYKRDYKRRRVIKEIEVLDMTSD
ncbi:hypothetical protein MMC27_004276 [Xylographa pallens]|nr:hypothetical protein [Xylographa pallens]